MRRAMGVFALLMIILFACDYDVRLPNYRNIDMDADIDEIEPEPEPAPETLSGIYEVNIRETENSCSYSDDHKEDRLDIQVWMTVITQSANEDGSLSVNLFLGNLSWYMVDIAPDGTFDHTETLSSNTTSNIAGILTPEEVSATIILEYSDTTNDFECHVVYEIEGELLFERANDEEDEGGEGEEDSLNGIYETQVVQTLNSCDGSAPWRATTWATITGEENLEDGSSLVNIFLNLWTAHISIENLFIGENGIITFMGLYSSITGEINPDYLTLSIHLYIISDTHSCSIFFEVNGYPIIERA